MRCLTEPRWRLSSFTGKGRYFTGGAKDSSYQVRGALAQLRDVEADQVMGDGHDRRKLFRESGGYLAGDHQHSSMIAAQVENRHHYPLLHLGLDWAAKS